MSPCDGACVQRPSAQTLPDNRFRDSATRAAHQIILMLSDILSFSVLPSEIGGFAVVPRAA
jgi:hypothetical protein